MIYCCCYTDKITIIDFYILPMCVCVWFCDMGLCVWKHVCTLSVWGGLIIFHSTIVKVRNNALLNLTDITSITKIVIPRNLIYTI